ncbi:hypothetical protein K443DRAFT_15508 [Laccaria amethystina LaAM-08-1]|uniref:Uncharacterized protein n=1 Tax=Laccaria amethystina LaAM-08-1 TaxID=1095629 RepID=A0A0C9WQS7_9AGAR|nr:hypothetical protein K443DRAFT_15508 [Laccaria amethystina LaAM-08-1]
MSSLPPPSQTSFSIHLLTITINNNHHCQPLPPPPPPPPLTTSTTALHPANRLPPSHICLPQHPTNDIPPDMKQVPSLHSTAATSTGPTLFMPTPMPTT